MPYLLFAVAIASAALAAVMCAIVVRMLREERRRSDARVEALLAASGVEPFEGPARAHAADAASLLRTDEGPQPTGNSVREGLDRDAGSPVAGVEGLFAAPDTSSPWPRRLGAVGAAAALLVAAIFASGWDDRTARADPDRAAASEEAAPLELLSLTHSTAAAGLTITGLVQNPRGGAALSEVTAVALLFSADGAFIGSGRAPLDFTRLDPGSESPFVVNVPTTKRVARYRVSFRRSDGAVIAHVDKRSGGPIARTHGTGAP